MKIAVPNDNGRVNMHFGRSQEFALVEIEGSRVISQKMISARDLQHNHEGLAELLSGQGVEALLAGGIGPFALEAIEKKGIRVITGVTGDIQDIALRYAMGDLFSKGTVCCGHHHGHGDHAHGCGNHGHDHRHGHCGRHHGQGHSK